MSVVVPIVLVFTSVLFIVLLAIVSVFILIALVGGVVRDAPHVPIVLCLFLVLVGLTILVLAILVINPKEKMCLWLSRLS